MKFAQYVSGSKTPLVSLNQASPLVQIMELHRCRAERTSLHLALARSNPFPMSSQKVNERSTVMFLVQSSSNPALNLAPCGRWTLRDKAAQRRLALR